MGPIRGNSVLLTVSGEFELAGNSSYRGFELTGFNRMPLLFFKFFFDRTYILALRHFSVFLSSQKKYFCTISRSISSGIN